MMGSGEVSIIAHSTTLELESLPARNKSYKKKPCCEIISGHIITYQMHKTGLLNYNKKYISFEVDLNYIVFILSIYKCLIYISNTFLN